MSIVKQSQSLLLLSGLVLGLTASNTIFAETTPSDSCKSAASLFQEDDIEGALEEARWCVTQLEQLKQGKTSSFFKDKIAGYTGGKMTTEQAMGMSIVERPYTNGSQKISVSMSGGAAGNAMSSLFGTLASMGMQGANGKKVRIQKRSAMMTEENGRSQVVVTLKSGGVLTFESSDLSSNDLVAFAKAFPVADLDDSRR